MIYQKCNILDALRNIGYTSYKLQKEGVLSSGSMQNLRDNFNGTAELRISMSSLNRICLILGKQPGDLIIEVATDEEKIKYFRMEPPK